MDPLSVVQMLDSMSDSGGSQSKQSESSSTTATSSSGTVSLACVRARISLILQEREKVPKPQANDKFPWPVEGATCKLCKRAYRETAQPLKGRPSPFLDPARAGSAICICCRNTLNWAFRGSKPAQVEQQVENSKEYAQRFLLIVLLWEDRFNNPSEAVVKVVAELPDAVSVRVLTTTSSGLESELMLGILWPAAVFAKHMGRQPEKHELTSVVHCGNSYRGVIREPCHGSPIGTIRLTSKYAVTQAKEAEQENSGRAVRGVAQCEDTYKALEQKMGVNLQHADESNKHVNAISMKRTPQQDDPLDDLWSSPFETKKLAAPKQNAKAGSRVRSSPASARQIAINTTEQVLLKSRQTCDLLCGSDCSVPIKQVRKLLK